MSGLRLKSQVVRPDPARCQTAPRQLPDDYEEGEASDADSLASNGRQDSESEPSVAGGDLDYAIELQRYTQHREQVEKRHKRRRRRSESDHERSSKQRTSSPSRSRDAESSGKKRAAADTLTTRTGGAYIPPARLRLMQEQITDKTSVAYQRLAWEALKKSLNGLVNKVNVANLADIVRELLSENVVRGRGLLCRSVLQAQAASPTFTHVYAALMAIVNSKFPQIGELLLHRLVLQFKRGFRRNDKQLCTSACRFIAHLVNHQVAHEVLALEVLTLLLETPSDDSVEVAVGFVQEVGQKLTELTPRGAAAIFERLRHILHEAALDKRVQYMIEVAFAVRKDGFKSYPSMTEGLDLLSEDDQFTHTVALDEQLDSHDMLNVFRHDPDYEVNEDKYSTIRREILESGSDSDDGDDSDDDQESDSDADQADEEESETAPIIDSTESVLRLLRQTIYLAIQSSLDFEETAHKLLRLQLKPGQEIELCHMIIDCCAQERSYLKFFGLLAERFCNYNRIYQEHFEQIFSDTYDTVHRLETGKLRNVAKLYSHLLHSDAISWAVLQHVRLTEEDTTSSSRIFIKICFQELSEFMGLARLCSRVNDPTLSSVMEGLFPRDNPKNTRFSINFFTSIGLGGLTEVLRQHLKSQPKPTAVVAPMSAGVPPVSTSNKQSDSSDSESSSSDSSSSSSSESSSSSSSDSSSTSDSSSSSDRSRRRNKKKQRKNGNKLGSKRRHGKDRSSDTRKRSGKHRSQSFKDEEKEKMNHKDTKRACKRGMSGSDEGGIVVSDKYLVETDGHREISDKRGEKSDRRGEKSDRHGEKSDRHGEKSDRHGKKSDRHGEKSDRHGDKSDRRGEKSDRHGEKADRHGKKSDRHGEKLDGHGEKSGRCCEESDRHGNKSDRHGEKSDRHGEKSDRRTEKSDRRTEKSDRRTEKSDRRGEKLDRHGEKSDRRGEKSVRHGEKSDRHGKKSDRHFDRSEPLSRPEKSAKYADSNSSKRARRD